MPDQETKVIEFLVRASPPSEWQPRGAPAEKLPAVYTVAEQVMMRDLARMLDSDPGVKAEMHTIHEVKAIFEAFLMDDEEVAERWPEIDAAIPATADQTPSVPSAPLFVEQSNLPALNAARAAYEKKHYGVEADLVDPF